MSREKLKVIVRGLPHDLSLKEFRSEIEARHRNEFDYFNYVQGKAPSGTSTRAPTPSYAKISFRSASALNTFAEEFNRKVYHDAHGNPHTAFVEYAPVQRLPQQCRVPHDATNTIDKDADYKRFLADLEAPAKAPIDVMEWLTAKLQEKKKSEAVVTDLAKDVMHEWFNDRKANTERETKASRDATTRSERRKLRKEKRNKERRRRDRKDRKRDKDREGRPSEGTTSEVKTVRAGVPAVMAAAADEAKASEKPKPRRERARDKKGPTDTSAASSSADANSASAPPKAPIKIMAKKSAAAPSAAAESVPGSAPQQQQASGFTVTSSKGSSNYKKKQQQHADPNA